MAQISVEDALEEFRKQYGKAVDENVLLRAQNTALERRVTELEQQLEGRPAPAGPDLAAQPPFLEGEQG
jgi:regulator of replication initiation timing